MRTLTQPLNMSPGGIPPVIHVSQYDSDFTIVFNLFSTVGDFAIESGTTAMVRGTKSSGTGYSADATINISAKTVTVTGNQQMTAAAGQNVFEITLLKSGKEISSKNFILLCERAALDADTITDETVLRELNAIIDGTEIATQAAEDANDAADRAEAAAQSFEVDSAPAQGSTNAVSSGGVYEALQNIDVSTDVTLSISGKPADAKAVGDTINNLVGGDEQREITGWVYSKYINVANANIGDAVDIANVSSYWSLKYVIVDCEAGDKFLLNLAGAASARAWAFLTSNNVLISKADASVTLTDVTIIAPQNAGKAIFQCIYRQSDTDTTTDNGKAYKIVQGSGDFVRFGVVQNKTEEEKARARGNISSYKEIQAEVSNFIYGEYIDLGTPNIGETVDLDNPIVWFSLKYAIVDCKEGDTFLLNVTGAANGRAYAFLTNKNVLISRADENATLFNVEITAPENAKKLIIQDIYRQTETDTISTGGTAHKIIPSVGVDFAVAFYSGHLIIE